MKNIFIAIFEEAATDQDLARIVKDHVKEREGKQFFEDNKIWQEDNNLTPVKLLEQIQHYNKVTDNFTGYEAI